MFLRIILSITVVLGLGLAPAPAPAAPLDGSVPILCAVTEAHDCVAKGGCEWNPVSQGDTFWRVNLQQQVVSSLDGENLTDRERPAGKRPAPPSRGAECPGLGARSRRADRIAIGDDHRRRRRAGRLRSLHRSLATRRVTARAYDDTSPGNHPARARSPDRQSREGKRNVSAHGAS